MPVHECLMTMASLFNQHISGVDFVMDKRRRTRLKLQREKFRNMYIIQQYMREEERTIMARELDGGLGQIMAAARMNVAWMKGEYAGDKRLFEKTSEILALIDGAIATIRRMCTYLRPDVPDRSDDLYQFALNTLNSMAECDKENDS